MPRMQSWRTWKDASKLVHTFKSFISPLSLILIGVQLQRKLTVGLFYVVLASITWHAEDCI